MERLNRFTDKQGKNWEKPKPKPTTTTTVVKDPPGEDQDEPSNPMPK